MPLRIILANDHPVVRNGIRVLPQNSLKDATVVEARLTDELYQAIEAAPCDVLLTDFHMPGGHYADGLHMLQRLGSHWPELPVIALIMVGNLVFYAPFSPLACAGW